MTVHFARTSRAMAASALTLVLATAGLPALAASEKALPETPRSVRRPEQPEHGSACP